MDIADFYAGKRVLITGHTGFKGSWLCKVLCMLGARVYGYALKPPTDPALFDLAGISSLVDSEIGDVRDLAAMERVFARTQPEIVFHLAAQPIVRQGYVDPVGTYETNIMGTVYVLECIRHTPSVRSFVNVTTDKVYENREWDWAYRETEPLNGFDPYANSKSCSELVTGCYRRSFFAGADTAISTARAGNVIGGGDFSPYRLIPDCVRAAEEGEDIVLRNPRSVRPYQHVLDALSGYLLIAAGQWEDPAKAGEYNIAPEPGNFLETWELANLFAKCWGGVSWTVQPDVGPHEDALLTIDSARIKRVFRWKALWDAQQAVEKTVEWYQCWEKRDGMASCMERQIAQFTTDLRNTDCNRQFCRNAQFHSFVADDLL